MEGGGDTVTVGGVGEREKEKQTENAQYVGQEVEAVRLCVVLLSVLPRQVVELATPQSSYSKEVVATAVAGGVKFKTHQDDHYTFVCNGITREKKKKTISIYVVVLFICKDWWRHC